MDDIRKYALIGARVRLSELESLVKETKEMIRLLQRATEPTAPTKVKTKGKRRMHTDDFKDKVVEETKSRGIAATANKHSLARSLVGKWVKNAKAR